MCNNGKMHDNYKSEFAWSDGDSIAATKYEYI